MDLSNRQEAEYWHKRAEEVADLDLRKEALSTHRKFLKLALREERMRLRLQNPGYGVLSMFVLVVFVALIVLIVILFLSKAYSVVVICTVFSLVFGLFIFAAAITLRVYGHINAETMLAMFKLGLKVLPASEEGKPVIEGTTAIRVGSSPPQRHLPSDTPVISSDSDNQ